MARPCPFHGISGMPHSNTRLSPPAVFWRLTGGSRIPLGSCASAALPRLYALTPSLASFREKKAARGELILFCSLFSSNTCSVAFSARCTTHISLDGVQFGSSNNYSNQRRRHRLHYRRRHRKHHHHRSRVEGQPAMSLLPTGASSQSAQEFPPREWG